MNRLLRWITLTHTWRYHAQGGSMLLKLKRGASRSPDASALYRERVHGHGKSNRPLPRNDSCHLLFSFTYFATGALLKSSGTF